MRKIMASALSRRAVRTLQTRLYSAAARRDLESHTPVTQAPKLTKLASGVTVASVENYSPISRIAIVVNAGSRFEDGDNLGVTHCLRVASGLSTHISTSFGITRSVDQAGADFTCCSTREHMFYKFDSLRGNLDLATDVLVQATTTPAFKPWELSEVSDYLRLDLAKIKAQPNIWVYDLLHQAAYRETLGRSLYTPEHMVGKHSTEQLLHYMKAYFSDGRLALVGVGVDHGELVQQADKLTPFSAADMAADKAKYSGGEMRVDIGGDLTYAAIAVEGPSLRGKDLLHAAVLQNVMGMGPAIKYSTGGATSRLTQAVTQTASTPFAVSCINANYSDSGLFGFYAVAPPKGIERVVRAAYKQFSNIAGIGLEEKDVARAKRQLKAQIGMYREGGDALLYDLGEQALGSEEILTTADLFKYVDSINTSDVTDVAKKLLDGKPSMAAVGNLSQTPYMDTLLR